MSARAEGRADEWLRIDVEKEIGWNETITFRAVIYTFGYRRDATDIAYGSDEQAVRIAAARKLREFADLIESGGTLP